MAFCSNLNDLENYFLQGKWIIAMRESCIEYKIYGMCNRKIRIQKLKIETFTKNLSNS